MEHTLIELGNFPNEILLVILKKLKNIEVLNFVIDVYKRLNRIGGDRTFTSHLSLIICSSNNSLYRPLPEPMLNRFCSQISPEIHDKINLLDLESAFMQRILVTKYPNLNRLGLYGIDVAVVSNSKTWFDSNEFSNIQLFNIFQNLRSHPHPFNKC